MKINKDKILFDTTNLGEVLFRSINVLYLAVDGVDADEIEVDALEEK